jgi:hypothetical protein
MGRLLTAAAVAIVSGALAPIAAADPIVDRDYAIELYEGVAIGDSALTGMGGAGAARVNGSAGVLINASAPAVRRTTDNDSWSWDYHLDFLTGRFSTDYDNNGQVAPEAEGAQLFTGGLALRFGKWSGALTVTGQSSPVDGSAMPALFATTLRGKFVIARWIPSWDLAIGAGIQSVAFQLGPKDGDPLFDLTGGGLVAGATWLPRGQSYRAAIALESRIVSSKVSPGGCDPNMCIADPDDPGSTAYILPEEIESPGRTIVGMAYRWAESPWNQQVKAKFRDEFSVTVSGDLILTGSSADGHGIEAFAMQQLQRSGAHVTVSPRAGVEVEALPGRLRLRAGSYWEPERFEGVRGRVHGTFGFELRALEFRLWGIRRGKLGATFDIARRYRNIGLSIGFWH